MKSPRTMPHLMTFAAIAAAAAAIGLSAVGDGSALASPAPIPSGKPIPGATVSLRDGGSNVGGTNRASGDLDSITSWCRGSVGILNAARQVVGSSLLNSDYATAIATYRGGIDRAIEQAEESGLDRSLTLSALRRADSMGRALSAAMIGQSDRNVRVVDYYNMAYDFLEKVADEIDLPLYIPYTRSNRRFDPLKYESSFANYGIEQLQWLLDNFTYESSEQYFSQFDSKVYLTLAEHITAGVADDLSQSVFANAYACQVQDLELLSQLLARHNAGDRTVYGGRDKYAVNGSAYAIKQVIQKLKTGCARPAF